MASALVPGSSWMVADMRGLNLDCRFDGIVAWNSFFHLTPNEQRAMFPVFRRHARPGAPLLFTSGPEYGEAIGKLEGESLYHASLDSSEYKDLLARHSFEVVAHAVEDPECNSHTVWLTRYCGHESAR